MAGVQFLLLWREFTHTYLQIKSNNLIRYIGFFKGEMNFEKPFCKDIVSWMRENVNTL